MEVNYPRINQQASIRIPQPPNSSCLAEQAHRGVTAGYMGPNIGPVQREFFRNHQLPHHLYPHPHPFHHPCDMHEAIQREIEKERIREEIIMSETRRRVLEAEVRRELMIERELALRRGGGSLPFGSSQQMEFDSPMRLSLLGTRAEGRSLDERIAMSLELTNRLNGRHEIGGFDTLPFQRGTTDIRISEVKPVSEGDKEKPKVILLAKPDENTSGSKRKAVTPLGVDASELPSNDISRKKAKEEWSCAICQVSATSERGLNEHLHGKKHKSKEAALRARKAGKNYSIGLFPKKATKPTQATETVDPEPGQVVKFTAESWAPMQENPKAEPESVQQAHKNGDLKDKHYRFWCQMCKVGTYSKKVMNAHQRGKKHVGRLRARDQNGGKTVVEDGKNIKKDNVSNENFDEMKSENDELVCIVEPEDKEEGGAEDITESDNGSMNAVV
ncbi:Deoxyribodipyrimidine photo-lyase [Handroanthus impetiginosus]|uniref:Deoxyribodipyrimidine photo-lyase n=1 Tax=Handroanthus impetiginosus TaxID=429701 RepID=A0A2G9GT79_9LAMI|nr:Deoxyribodipyrimidine photo-lyase [Handroanthus impetiginosus]